MSVALHQLTALIYLVAGIAAGLASAVPLPRLGRVAVRLLALAVAIHAVSFAMLHTAQPSPSLTDLPVVISFMAWAGALSFLLLLRRAHIAGLVVLVGPAAFVGVFYAALRLPEVGAAALEGGGSWPHAHVLLASAGLSLLGLAALAGLLFLAEHRRLKAKRPAHARFPLPSLEALDRANVAALTVGFPLLTLGVITGALWSQTARGQLWGATPHELWSLIAWVIYAVLVTVRFGSDQGSRQAAVSAVGGFVFLFLAVIGLELFVWKVLLLGMNHRSAPLELREQLAVDDPAPLLRKLVAGEEVEEAALLSTCNRVEVVALARNLEAGRDRLQAFFQHDLAGSESLAAPADLDRHLYEFAETDAVRHLLRVASALDSMVVGEPQILGQTKDAYRVATDCGACGPILDRLFQNAFSTAKRVRTETRLAERPVSVARVAVDLAGQIFDEFGDKRAVLIGAGEMIEAALQALRSRGLEFVSVANRTPERAAELAARFGATAHGLEELPGLLSRADVVLTSIGGDRPILTRELVSAALQTRRKRPIFVIDLGVPRNAEPEIDQLENLYLYDIDDLGSVAADNAEERRSEAVRAEAIVVEQEQRFRGWLAGLQAVPTIRALRVRLEAIRSQEVERALGRLGLESAQAEGVEALTRSLVNKILHAPLSRLREEAERGEGMTRLEAARALFDLGDAGAAKAGGSEVPPEDAGGPGGAE